jgi:hypothetical protein
MKYLATNQVLHKRLYSAIVTALVTIVHSSVDSLNAVASVCRNRGSVITADC